MIVISPQTLAAEQHRREVVAQAIHEQWVDQVLQPPAQRDADGAPVPRAADASLPVRARMRRSARSLIGVLTAFVVALSTE